MTSAMFFYHRKVKAALDEQTALLWHSTNIYMHPRVHEYGKKLVDTLPPHLNVSMFMIMNFQYENVSLNRYP